MSHTLRVASYRFRATLARQWSGYLGLMLLIALVGGVAMASLAGARRTESSFPVYVASTNPATTAARAPDCVKSCFSPTDNVPTGNTAGCEAWPQRQAMPRPDDSRPAP